MKRTKKGPPLAKNSLGKVNFCNGFLPETPEECGRQA